MYIKIINFFFLLATEWIRGSANIMIHATAAEETHTHFTSCLHIHNTSLWILDSEQIQDFKWDQKLQCHKSHKTENKCFVWVIGSEKLEMSKYNLIFFHIIVLAMCKGRLVLVECCKCQCDIEWEAMRHTFVQLSDGVIKKKIIKMKTETYVKFVT